MSDATARVPSAGVTDAERLPVLDIVRGVALLGILIMNIPLFVQSEFAGADGSRLWPGAVDRAAGVVIGAVFAGKFNSMFSLLFAIGFTLQYQRLLERSPETADAVYLRRLLALLAIGLLHGVLLWFGDVLHVYALLGLLLIGPLRRLSDRAVFALIGLTLLYPVVAGGLRLAMSTPERVARRVAESQRMEAAQNAAFGQGSMVDAMVQNAHTFFHSYTSPWGLYGTGQFVAMLFTTLLLGLLIGRHRLVQRIPEFMPQIRRAQWWALGLGLACGAASSIIWDVVRSPGPSGWKLLAWCLFVIGRLALTTFYVLTIVRLVQHPAWMRRFEPLAIAGRMPLTNYLMQSVIGVTLGHAWGFGLWGRVGPAAGLAIAVAIFFVVQVPFSRWWLRRRARGPMEALWHWLTYGKWPAARTGPAVASGPA